HEYEHIVWQGPLRTSFIVQDTCVQCGRCHRVCPYAAIEAKEGRFFIHGDLCEGCGLCLSICPVRAIVWEEGVGSRP
ncbi:MAG: 4Fe-4S binding protein, partial [Candidatus Bipolaricaulota bacterium]